MTFQRLSGVRDVAKLLGAPEDMVLELLEEGRLGGVLLDTLRRKGVPVTPTVKNSVRSVVRAMEPRNSRLNSGVDKSERMDAGPTVTIMFTDIVNSTAIVDRLGDTRSRDVLRVHDQIVRGHTDVHGGTEVKSMGDGFMLTFPSARRGVACGVAIQSSLQDYSSLHPDSPLGVRIGLSVGEPVREEQDLFGKSITLAARISAQAQGGQVLISQIVHALVSSTEEFAFKEVGTFELNGISVQQTLYEVLWKQT